MHKKFYAVFLSVVLVFCCMPFSENSIIANALGDILNADLSYGSISTTATSITYYDSSYIQHTADWSDYESLRITQTASAVSATQNTITVTGNPEGGAKVILAGVNIDTLSNAVASISLAFAQSEIILEDGTLNTLRGNAGNAALSVPYESSLTISGSGELQALSLGASRGGAGIGANQNENCGEIIINSGTIKAYGSGGAAAIGGGWHSELAPDALCGNVTINGGYITLKNAQPDTVGFSCPALISNADGNAQLAITINGGTIVADDASYTDKLCASSCVLTINSGNIAVALDSLVVALDKNGSLLYLNVFNLTGASSGDLLTGLYCESAIDAVDMKTVSGGFVYMYLPEFTRISGISSNSGFYPADITTDSTGTAQFTLTAASEFYKVTVYTKSGTEPVDVDIKPYLFSDGSHFTARACVGTYVTYVPDGAYMVMFTGINLPPNNITVDGADNSLTVQLTHNDFTVTMYKGNENYPYTGLKAYLSTSESTNTFSHGCNEMYIEQGSYGFLVPDGLYFLWVSYDEGATYHYTQASFLISDNSQEYVYFPYQIIYDLNGGSGALQDIFYAFGMTAEISSGKDLTGPPDKLFFSRWRDSSDLTGNSYLEGDTITISDNLYLYAEYCDTAALFIEDGPISITASGFTQGTLTRQALGKFSISQRDPSVATGNSISVTGGAADILVNSLNIASGTAFSISSGGSVNLTLVDSNQLKSSSNAGIAMASNCSLSIFEQGTGSLAVQGASGSRPGIGVGGTVSVYSGTVSVTAGNGNYNSEWLGTGGAGGAGINGTLRVFGGSITVKGGNGGGEDSYGTGGNGGVGASELYISGGIVSITGGAGGAAGSYGHSGHGGAGVYSFAAEGGTLSLKGGAGGNGTEYFGNGGNGGHGVSGASLITGGSLLLLGGRAGSGTSYGNSGSAGKPFAVQPTDGTNELWPTTISFEDISCISEILSLDITPTTSSYGINDVFTDANGKIYIYLPATTAVYKATLGETEYYGYIRQCGVAVSGSLTTTRLYRFTISTYHNGNLADVLEDFSLSAENSLSTRVAQGVYVIYALPGDYDILYNGVDTDSDITVDDDNLSSIGTNFYYVSLSGQNVTFNQKSNQTIPFLMTVDILATADTGYTFHGLPQISGDTVDILVSSGGYRIKGTPLSDITVSFGTLPNTYTISLSTESKELENSPSEYVSAVYTSSFLRPLINPVHEHLEFTGWYTDIGGTGRLVIGTDGNFVPSVSGFTDSDGSYIKTQDTTLYAGWISNITLSTEEVLLKNTPSASAKIVNNTNTIAQPVTNPERDGYNFTGWYTQAGGTGSLVITSSGSLASTAPEIYLNEEGNWICETSVTLYAGWSLRTYNITINHNGGYKNGAATVEFTSNKVTINTPPLKLAHKILGYYTDSACTELICLLDGTLVPDTLYTNSEGLWTYPLDAVFYTKWEAVPWEDGSLGISEGLYTVSGGPYDKTTNPYKISTAAELAYLSQQVTERLTISDLSNNTSEVFSYSAGYKITADISLGGEESTVEWCPIQDFNGILDADGHTISNLSISSGQTYIGLFGLTDSAEIKNLVLENVDISVNLSSNSFAGALIGYCDNTDVTNCSSSGVIILYGNSSINIYAGGIFGYSNYSTLTGVSSCVFLQDNLFQRSYVGGLTGNDRNSKYINCFASSDINSNSTLIYVGGLCGMSDRGDFKNCFTSKATISGSGSSTANAGGFCGYSFLVKFTNCFTSVSIGSLSYPYAYKGQLSGYTDRLTVNACYMSGDSTTHAYGRVLSTTTTACGYFAKDGDDLIVSAGTADGFGSNQTLSYGTDLLLALNSWVVQSGDPKYAAWYPDCRYFPENDGLPQFKELPLYSQYRLLQTDKMKSADYFTSFVDFQGYSQVEIIPFSGTLCGTGTRIICTAQEGAKVYYVLILPGDLNGDSITDLTLFLSTLPLTDIKLFRQCHGLPPILFKMMFWMKRTVRKCLKYLGLSI